MPQRILAVEFTGDLLRAATADRTWNSFQFLGVFENRRNPDENDLVPALKRLIEKTGRPDVVISALPPDSVAKRLLELPFRDLRRLHQVVPFALEEHLPFPVDGAAVTFVRVGRSGDGSLVMAAFARRQEVNTHLQLLGRAGLDPKTVTITPFAIAAMLARWRNGSQPTAHLVVDADPGSTSLLLLDKQGIPRAMRTINAGMLLPDGSPRPAEELAPIVNAARQTMLAHASELDRADLVITGRGALVPGLRNSLSDALALKAYELDCSRFFEGADPSMARFAGPVAMLLGETPNKPIELLNFRQGEFAFHGRTHGDLTAFYTSGALAVGLVAVILFYLSLGVYGKVHRLHVLDREIAKIAAPALDGHVSSDPIAQLRSGIGSMQKQLNLIGGNMSRNSALDTLLTVSQSIPHLPAEILDLQVDPTGLRIRGLADSFGTVDQVKGFLNRSGEFGAIEVDRASSSNEENKVEFHLNASFPGTELANQ